ncbi:MAG: aldose 1-epimerase [Chloroflexota bacterium]
MSERFEIETVTDTFWSGETRVLRDRERRSWARVVPGLGCDLVSFGAEIDGRAVETFLQPADEPAVQPPGHFGAPVLYPFPNRLSDGHARFGGRDIQVDRTPGQRHAIHGLVRDRVWSVVAAETATDAATLVCAVESDAATERQFPFKFRLALTFQLSGRALRMGVEGTNLGDAPMPMGFGWHPYFRLPLVPGGDRRAAVVRIPAQKIWQLDETLVPTGAVVAASPERDFRAPRTLGSVHLDDVYTALDRSDDHSACELGDRSSNLRLRVAAGPTFREWVVYAPATRPTICFEPYTCPTDAFNLASRGIDAGVIVLEPGQRWNDWVRLDLGTFGA